MAGEAMEKEIKAWLVARMGEELKKCYVKKIEGSSRQWLIFNMNIEMRKNLYAMKRDDRKIQNRVFKARPFDKQNLKTQGNIEDVGTDKEEEMIQKNDEETPEQPLEDTLTEKTDEINPMEISSEEKSNIEPVSAAALAPTPVLELTHIPEPEKNKKKEVQRLEGGGGEREEQ